jgi:hypothetical protein
MEWIHPQSLDTDLVVGIDSTAPDYEETFDTNYDIDTDIAIVPTSVPLNTGNFYDLPKEEPPTAGMIRGNLSQGLEAAQWYSRYVDSTIWADCDNYDAYISCADVVGSPWIAPEMASSDHFGTQELRADDVAGIDIYWFYLVEKGAGSGGTKLNTTTISKTYYSDELKIQYIIANSTGGDGNAVKITVGIECASDGTDITDADEGTAFTLEYNDATNITLTYESGCNWTVVESSMEGAERVYDTVFGSDCEYDITIIDMNSQSLTVNWNNYDYVDHEDNLVHGTWTDWSNMTAKDEYAIFTAEWNDPNWETDSYLHFTGLNASKTYKLEIKYAEAEDNFYVYEKKITPPLEMYFLGTLGETDTTIVTYDIRESLIVDGEFEIRLGGSDPTTQFSIKIYYMRLYVYEA